MRKLIDWVKEAWGNIVDFAARYWVVGVLVAVAVVVVFIGKWFTFAILLVVAAAVALWERFKG